MSGRTGAVVVTHRTPQRARRCVASLGPAGAEVVVVVDAGSDDGTVDLLRADGTAVVALTNVGFGRAANAGVAALPGDVDVVVVANADTVFAPGAVAALAAALRADGAAVAAGPLVTYPDGRPQAAARRLPTLGQALGHALFGLWWPTNRWTLAYRRIGVDGTVAADGGPDWLSGCALGLDRAAFTAVGGFDPGYFLYAEDVDLGVRLRAAGGRLVTVPSAVVVHEVGASTGVRPVAALVAHARGLDRFAGQHVLTGPRAALRPLVRLGLAGWVASSLVWRRFVGAHGGRASTGE